jgi:hypothetical protein
MFIGHFAAAFAGKAAAAKANLGVRIAAAQLPDLLWPIFLLLGWESVEISPGETTLTPPAFTSYPISHSLLTVALWGAVAGVLYFAFKRDSQGEAASRPWSSATRSSTGSPTGPTLTIPALPSPLA